MRSTIGSALAGLRSRSAMARWMAAAQATASTTLSNTDSVPSPISLTRRPAMVRQQGLDHLARASGDPADGADLVGFHLARIADHVAWP